MMKRTVLTIILIASVVIMASSLIFRFYRISGKSLHNHLTFIRVSEKKIKLGKVFPEDAHATFYIYNKGVEELLIETIEVSCSCSSSNVDNRPVPPGDSLQIRLYYNKTVPGYFYSDVIIRGNFDKSPEILSFEGVLVLGKKQTLTGGN